MHKGGVGDGVKENVLGDFVGLQRGITYKSSLLDLPGPYLLGLGSIRRNGGFRENALRSYGGDSPEKLILRPGDIYVSLKDVTQSGDLLGAVSRVPSTIPKGRLTQDTVKLVFKNDTISKDFIFWILRTPQYRAYCRGRGTGTTNLDLSRDDFLTFQIPDLTPDRITLISTLEAIEKKIELNRRMNATLEAMARALFRSWFVDFDPVRAKVEGRQPAGMDEATAALFPDAFEESELGEIPMGWDVASLDEIANFLNGLALQNFRPQDGEEWLPVIKIAQLKQETTSDCERACASIKPDCIINDGDIIFSWSGSLEVVIWCGGKGALNQHLFKVTSSSFPKWFYYEWLLFHLDDFRATAQNKATTMGHIQRHHLTDAKVLIPPRELLDLMSKMTTPLIEKTITLKVQSRTLASLRDILLPELLSGHLTINILGGCDI